MASTTKMTYRFLGDSGLLVSKLALGAWMDARPEYTADAWFELMKTAFGHGINFFDTAECYNWGHSEELMGDAIVKGINEGVWTREDLVVSTKIFAGTKGFTECGPNGQGVSRKHLVEGIRISLKKMQLEYVDVIFCHRSEPYTPIEETVRAMNFIINQGLAFYWGTSEWSSADIAEACAVADKLGLIRPIVEQPQYNMFERSKVEFAFADLYKKYKLGLTVWSPLASGILTGKYSRDLPTNSRLANEHLQSLFAPKFAENVAKARELQSVADKVGCSMAQLSIAWCVSNENVSTVLLGARNSTQLDETVKALEFVDKLTPEVKSEIDAIVKFVPELPAEDHLYRLRGRHLAAAEQQN